MFYVQRLINTLLWKDCLFLVVEREYFYWLIFYDVVTADAGLHLGGAEINKEHDIGIHWGSLPWNIFQNGKYLHKAGDLK